MVLKILTSFGMSQNKYLVNMPISTLYTTELLKKKKKLKLRKIVIA